MTSNGPKLERRVLDERGHLYIKNMLTLDTLFCRVLAETVDFAAGDAFTFVPSGLPDANVYDFTAGFAAPRVPPRGGLVPVETIVETQVAEVMRFLRMPATACAIADDANQHRSAAQDGQLPNSFDVGAEVYALLTAQDGPDTVRAVLSGTNWIWHGLVALCVPSRTPSRADLGDPAAFAAVLRTTRAVQAVAYDGEGYLEWRRAAI